MVIAHATDGNLAVTNLNQSPFNVGLEMNLVEFNLEQIATLASRHQLDFSPEQIIDFNENIGGHPYLVRKAMYDIKTSKYSFNELISKAAHDTGPFADHLQRQYWKLSQNKKAFELYTKMLKSQPIDDELTLSSLRAAGLAKGYGANASPSFKIYKEYFSAKL
jgi:serine/threonine-protein kinase